MAGINIPIPDDFSDYEKYSKTPPRTKILRKIKEKKSKSNKELGPTMSPTKPTKIKQSRRQSSTTTNYFPLQFDDDTDRGDDTELPLTNTNNKKSCKRQIKLLRGSERDLKLDITSAQAVSHTTHEKIQKTPQPSYQIESYNRFKSLSCRTIPCFKLFGHGKQSVEKCPEESIDECPQNRVDFFETISNLIQLGYGDRKIVHKDENVWQNELKDVIWLELRAFLADRTPLEEDDYLCSAREGVEPLLNDIMTYKFQKQSKYYLHSGSDSGVEDDCPGCLSMYCLSCSEGQNEALRDVEKLMNRLEKVESLFPSSKAFAELYPTYNDPAFVGRVKAISLWYNMTKHQRLKLMIIGKLAKLDNKNCHWPILTIPSACDSTSPSDSNNSSGSSVNDLMNDTKPIIDYYNNMLNDTTYNPNSAYRNYIENVLKTRTLQNGVSFLNKLHHFVLGRVCITLKKPLNNEIFSKVCCNNEEEELQRYGTWCPETQAMALPSYRPAFLFLSTVCLDVFHEFLKLRIEQKPDKPSPLSVRQLMRELKEGLRLAILQKQKYVFYIECAINGTNDNAEGFKNKIKNYEQSLYKAFSDYLDYLEQWSLLHHDTFQKNLLEEEWNFSCKIVEDIPGGLELLGEKFNYILLEILKSSKERLGHRIEETLSTITNSDKITKQMLFSGCREMQSVFTEEREMCVKTLAFCKTIFRYHLPKTTLEDLKGAVVSKNCYLTKVVERVQILYDYINAPNLDESEKTALIARMREIMMQCYRFAFEYYREIGLESMPKWCREKLVRSMVFFANLWMKFVTEKCERGRGMKPRWAYQGLEFLLTVCEPRNAKFLTEEEFDDLRTKMEFCISHVIGSTGPSTPDSGIYSAKSSLEFIRTRSRGSSPSPRLTYRSQRSNNSRKVSLEQGSPGTDSGEAVLSSFRNDDEKALTKIKLPPNCHTERCLDAIESVENQLDNKLRHQNLIGKVISCNENKKHIRKKYVTFTWQRGIKIGQGRFGKVYTAVNNNTGEMMAVKEIALQHNDNLTLKRVAEEMKILEGIHHKYLVRYYGVEVHKEEMLIFMEFCAEGTLESLVAASEEQGLSELLVRRYTFQLVSGVACLHDHGIVHRDIKTANIFLTNGGNCLKIGDFGCAAKIKSHTTMPGELQGFVGTQAYMAPEVFTKNMSEGHGRAADVWSVGCVVVEMASGKRPWAQYDSNYQIMFKVGMGQHPDPPDNMTDEGISFLELCFKHNPRERATAYELLDHSFVKMGEDL